MAIKTDSRGAQYDDTIARMENEANGWVFQVLNEFGDDWDEAATVAALDAWLREQPAQ